MCRVEFLVWLPQIRSHSEKQAVLSVYGTRMMERDRLSRKESEKRKDEIEMTEKMRFV